jgi:A/G-specific adenine glycosylase
LTRLYDIDASVDTASTKQHLWKLAGDLVSPTRPGDFNQGLMELGARICTPKSPECGTCPVRNQCVAKANGVQESRPVRKPRKAVAHHEIVVAAIAKNGRYLLGKRPAGGLLGGLWEFPGGKVEQGETHQAALVREVREELGIEVEVGGLVASVNHAYSHFKVTLNVYSCAHLSGEPAPNTHTALKWVRKSEFTNYAFPKANHKFLDLL